MDTATNINHKIDAVKKISDALTRSAWYSPATMQERQYHRLAQLLTHCLETVPFYQTCLKQAHYQPRQQLTPTFLQSLPIFSRQQLQQAQDSTLKSTLFHNDDYQYSIVTSGSTGVAVRLIGTFETACYWQALSLRDHYWHQRDFSKTLAAIRWAPHNIALPPLGEVNQHWGNVTDGIISTGPSFFLNVLSPTHEQLKWLQMIDPHYLISFPSQLKVLLLEIINRGIRFNHLLEIRTIGETVDDELRGLAHTATVKLTDLYSAKECGIIAIQCPEFKNYHVQSENVILEIVDAQGQPCEYEQDGRVIITHLHNFATPLLRYEIGDYAQFAAPCPCGRDALPTLKKICGRRRNRLIMPTGESRFPYLGDREERRAITTAIKKFQLVQHTVDNLEFKIVVDNRLTFAQEQHYIACIQKDLGYPFAITITYHDDIARQANGKFEEFISYVTQ